MLHVPDILSLHVHVYLHVKASVCHGMVYTFTCTYVLHTVHNQDTRNLVLKIIAS